eukprot:scaffold12186_cov143-Amphora_coffeaeformis.AAC.3
MAKNKGTPNKMRGQRMSGILMLLFRLLAHRVVVIVRFFTLTSTQQQQQQKRIPKRGMVSTNEP